MLFCARAAAQESHKWRLHSCATSRKPFELLHVGTKMTVLSGHQLVAKISTGTANTRQTLRIPCISVHAREARWDEPRKVTLGSSPNTSNSCAFCVVGRNRGAPRRHVGAPNGSAFSYQHVEIQAVFAPGRPHTNHTSGDSTLAPHRENPLNYCVLVRK